MKSSTSTHEQEHDHHHQAIPSDVALRVKALESLLVEKGLVDPVALDELIDAYGEQDWATESVFGITNARIDHFGTGLAQAD